MNMLGKNKTQLDMNWLSFHPPYILQADQFQVWILPGERISVECLKRLYQDIVSIYQEEYLCIPSEADTSKPFEVAKIWSSSIESIQLLDFTLLLLTLYLYLWCGVDHVPHMTWYGWREFFFMYLLNNFKIERTSLCFLCSLIFGIQIQLALLTPIGHVLTSQKLLKVQQKCFTHYHNVTETYTCLPLSKRMEKKPMNFSFSMILAWVLKFGSGAPQP